VIAGVVLAAGEGRRFGGTKQIEIVEGKPLAQHAIDALAAAGLDEILVVIGHDAEAVERALTLPPGGRFLRNDAYRDGQSTSLAAALGRLGSVVDAAVVLMGDQPGITAAHVRALVDAFGAGGRQIVRLRFADGPGPALLSRRIFAEASHLHGDVGARTLIRSHPDLVVDVDVDEPTPPDLDTRADLERLASASD
jgi:molybdenum cofactor cytidylyltransferase